MHSFGIHHKQTNFLTFRSVMKTYFPSYKEEINNNVKSRESIHPDDIDL